MLLGCDNCNLENDLSFDREYNILNEINPFSLFTYDYFPKRVKEVITNEYDAINKSESDNLFTVYIKNANLIPKNLKKVDYPDKCNICQQPRIFGPKEYTFGTSKDGYSEYYGEATAQNV